MELLHQEARLISIQIQLVPDGKLSRIQRRKYRLLQLKIFKYCEDYNSSEMIARCLMKLCSYINGPDNRCWKPNLQMALLGATGPLRGATKSEKVMINKNLVWFLLVFFFWQELEKTCSTSGSKTNVAGQTRCWMKVFDCLAKASWNTYKNTNKGGKPAITTQASSQKNVDIESHQSY